MWIIVRGVRHQLIEYMGGIPYWRTLADEKATLCIYVCGPIYIGANIGICMSDYVDEMPYSGSSIDTLKNVFR
jgi:hypothetical protein